ncbi:hypothetical protein GOP47_0004900 [Adiantum capillus-veneris]|uniref:BZIP domain-containing protein n=1 Tax=Adiantum capillus-veneris TaxID=13818 RepID=A0A9D4ZN47_ADICA|nr:hypothetical protein GOP47_0004900 [Adiantum capillus-veneris]
MGSGEMGAPTKTTKTSSTQQPQEPPPVSTPQPYDWAAAFQAYYGSGTAPMPPHGYFPSSVGSGPQPHPYMWGPQHLMAPYTPPPYAAIYAHGGMYGHPSIPPGTHPYGPYALPPGSTIDAQGNTTPASADGDGKSSEGKTKNSLKRTKGSLGSLGMLTGKGSESGKGSMSADSGSEGSTEGSEGTSQNGSDGGHKGADQVATSAPYGSGQDGNHAAVQALPLSIAGKQVMGAGPLTNLNIGMDYWNGGAPAVLAHSGVKRPTPGTTTAMIPSGVGLGREVVPSDLWQDERELKRQRRKQSNRESARRSRLRKQAECEELAAKVHSLEGENTTLRSELTRITEQCNKLSQENRSLMEQMHMRGIQPESPEADLDRKDMNHTRGERRDTGSLQVDNEHFHRDSRAVNDTFSVANDSGNLAVSVSSG